MKIEDVLIIGAGPAGISCAIQLKRYGISALILDRGEIGGLIINANKIENYLGFPNGISGIKFVELLKKQLNHFNIEIQKEEVQNLEYIDPIFHVHTNIRIIKTHFLVLATGTNPKKITGFEIPKEIEGQVFYEVYPIRECNNKKIAVIGAGDAAFDYALNLSRNNEVSILNKSNRIKCLKVLKDECDRNPKIEYLSNTAIEKLEYDNELLLLSCKNNGSSMQLKVDYLLIAIGREANDEFITQCFKDNYQELIINKRLFVIGDVKNGQFRQLSLCVGDGIKTAMEISQKINL